MTSICLFFALLATTDDRAAFRQDFEDASVGKLPAKWSSDKTGEGDGSVWMVALDASSTSGAKVLAQTSSDGPSPLFNLCVADEVKFRDLDLTVTFKAVSGETDQGGGPVWRFIDRNNYYIARMNPLENNFRVYKVKDGKRTQLATVKVEALAEEWHTIRVVHQGDRIQCFLNGVLHLDVTDKTFEHAGKVGLWTKADAVNFDNLTVKPPKAADGARESTKGLEQ